MRRGGEREEMARDLLQGLKISIASVLQNKFLLLKNGCHNPVDMRSMERNKRQFLKNILCFYFIIFTFTYMCIHCLCHLPLPLLPGRNCSAFSDLVEKKT
jgi:hypothetical protein